jgi:hypothetical protein
VAHRKALDVYGDSVTGDRSSPIERLSSLDLSGVMCRDDDRGVDNAHDVDDVTAVLPQELRPFSVIGGQVDANAPHGIPTMSVASGLIYDIGQRDGQWGLSAVDFDTGEQEMFVPSGHELDENSFFAGSEVGPDSSIWTGTLRGVSVFRPNEESR